MGDGAHACEHAGASGANPPALMPRARQPASRQPPLPHGKCVTVAPRDSVHYARTLPYTVAARACGRQLPCPVLKSDEIRLADFLFCFPRS